MIVTLFIIALSFYWLLLETDYLRARLPVGKAVRWGDVFLNYVPQIAYQYDNSVPAKRSDFVHGYSIRHALKGTARINGMYEILLSPNVEPMCGREWLDAHWNDLVDYTPDVAMIVGNVRFYMTIRDPSIIKDVMKATKLSRQYKIALGITKPKRVKVK